MLLDRRSLLALGAGAALAPAAGRAQSAIPDKAVRLLLGAGTGGGLDQMARLIAPQLERRTGRHVTIEYRSGGTGPTVAEAIKSGPGDGSHLALMPTTTVGVLIASKSDAPDIAPISLIGSFPMALAVSTRIGVSSLEEYVAWLKAGDAQRATLGTAATADPSLRLFAKMLDRDLGVALNVVAIRNPSAMMTDLESGRLPAAMATVPTLFTAHRGGRVRILMTTGAGPMKVPPRLPTALELGLKDFELREWYCFVTSGKAPKATVDAWNGHIRDVLEDRGLKGELTQLGLDLETSTPEEAGQRIAAQAELWKTRMEALGAKPPG